MKIKTAILTLAFASSTLLADMYIDLTKTPIKCKDYTITQKSTSDDLKKYCNVIDIDRDMEINGISLDVKFLQEGSNMPVECKFFNGTLKLCYYDN